LPEVYRQTDEKLDTDWEGNDVFAWEVNEFAQGGYRMPTLFEWEAAHRGGTNSKYSFGNQLSRIGSFAVTSVEPHLIPALEIANRGLKMPNPFGIFDTNGNVQEWCQDNVKYYPARDRRGLRGGHSLSSPRYFQSSARHYSEIYDSRINQVGIRLVIQID
jgi:formylglycine-generating enzyme required for sulfatase activity